MRTGLEAMAVVLQGPEDLRLRQLELSEPGPADLVVDVEWTAISTGTERLLWTGRMPPFPGMGYPLVPGYESVGRIASAGPDSGHAVGERVFVPGARCFGSVRGLFGGAASRLVVAGERVQALPDAAGEEGVLLALAATAHHAIEAATALPELIVGHGALGRLLARLIVLRGGAPVVWELEPSRRSGAVGYDVLDPADDPRQGLAAAIDVSGDTAVLDSLIAKLRPAGEIVLAGFYADRVSFAFPPAFMREVTFKIAAQWQPSDLKAVAGLVASGALSLDGLISHRATATDAVTAYRTAFDDTTCLKMILDWRGSA